MMKRSQNAICEKSKKKKKEFRSLAQLEELSTNLT